MAMIREWMFEFLSQHRARFRPHDWAHEDTEEYLIFASLWVAAFNSRNVTRDEADRASIALAECPPRFHNDHLPAILSVIDMTREHGEKATRTGTRLVSRRCSHCGVSSVVMVPMNGVEPQQNHNPPDRTEHVYSAAEIDEMRGIAASDAKDFVSRTKAALARATLTRLGR